MMANISDVYGKVVNGLCPSTPSAGQEEIMILCIFLFFFVQIMYIVLLLYVNNDRAATFEREFNLFKRNVDMLFRIVRTRILQMNGASPPPPSYELATRVE